MGGNIYFYLYHPVTPITTPSCTGPPSLVPQTPGTSLYLQRVQHHPPRSHRHPPSFIPVACTAPPSPVPQTHGILPPPSYLQRVQHHPPRSNRHPEPFHCIVEGLHHVRRRLEDIGPDIIHEVHQRVLTSKPHDTQGHVLHSPARCLTVDKVPGKRQGGKETL